jgi:hypothetical protein
LDGLKGTEINYGIAPMLKVLAGELSATFNIDGQHFDRYIGRKISVVGSLCDQLLLHDQILIPTQDYLTAAGLIRIIGEHNVLTLLGEERISFIRLRGAFGYVRGTGDDGRLLTFNSPNVPSSMPIDQSVAAGLSVIDNEYKERKRLPELLISRSYEIEMQTAVDATHVDTYTDLFQTALWKEEYRLPNPELLALPGAEKMGVRVIGPGTDVSKSVIDACLALGLMNIELYLAKKYGCENVSTASPIGDCVSLKLSRLTGEKAAYEKLWNFLEVVGIPEISGPLLADQKEMAKFIKLTRGRDAEGFRQWFSEKSDLTDKDILKAYIDLLHETPWIQGKVGRTLRIAASLGLGALGLGLLVDAAASVVDSFVVDKVVHVKGAKFFLENLRSFSGRIEPRT